MSAPSRPRTPSRTNPRGGAARGEDAAERHGPRGPPRSRPEQAAPCRCPELSALLSEITGVPPALWASGIVGFGTYHYRYNSGREGDAPVAGFAPRSAHLVIYLVGGFTDRHEGLLERLGPHKTGKSCLYVKRLADIDLDVLRTPVTRSMKVHRGQDRASER